jgi:hypothetical protein
MKYYIGFVLTVLLFGCLGGPACPDTIEPVCGSDGNTYDNACLAQQAGVEVESEGECEPPQLDCIDSDDGKDLSIGGQVLGEGKTLIDKCKDDTTVVEYFCKDNVPSSEEIPCPEGDVCDAGVCVLAPCSDSDDGLDESEQGTVTSGTDSETDVCAQNGSVKEFICDGDEIAFQYLECDSDQHCVDGACADYECEDSDDGKDVSTKGTTSYMDDSSEDVCEDHNTVKEHYCDGKDIKIDNIECESSYICEDGACVEGPECYDSDNGKDKFIFGTLIYEGDEYPDECYDADEVMEYYCVNEEPKSEKLDCGSDHECTDGECTVVQCKETESTLEEENVRFEISNYGSSDKLRLYDGEAVEIEDDLILELISLSGNDSTFRLYQDFEEYLDDDPLCTIDLEIGNSEDDLCGESTGDVEVDSINEGDQYVEMFIDEYYAVEYYSVTGTETTYEGFACDDDDFKIYETFEAYFFPRIDTSSQGLDLDRQDFKFFDITSEIEDIDLDEELLVFEINSDEYELTDGEDLEFTDNTFDVDLYTNDLGIYRIKLRLD